jgi:hypothetical protein
MGLLKVLKVILKKLRRRCRKKKRITKQLICFKKSENMVDNEKRIVLLLILFTVIAGLILSNASAVEGVNLYKKTIKFKDNSNGYISSVKVGSKYQDRIHYAYVKNYKNIDGWVRKQTAISMNNPYNEPSKYHLYKAWITFVKKVNGKNKYVNKWFKADKYEIIGYNAKNGYKPYKAVVYYYKK